MATEPRVVGTDLDNGAYIAQDVKVTATQTTIADAAGDFVSTTVEGALAELAARLSAVEGGGGGTATTTATAVASSQNPAVSGSSVTITATVTSGGTPVTTGTVTFKEGTTTLSANVALNGSGQASFITAALSVASHTITATYSGVANAYLTSNGQVTQVISSGGGGGSGPAAPTNLTATASQVGVTLNWTPPAGSNLIGGDPHELASYNIEQSTNATTGFTLVSTVAAGTTMPRLIYPLTAGVTYYFRVRASYMVTPTAYGAYSNVANAAPSAGPPVPATWDDAVATNDLIAITLWYQANTGYLSEGFNPANMWGPAQTADVTIDDAWLTANAGANVVLNAGRWTVTGLHAQYITVARDNVTLTHCLGERPFAMNANGLNAGDGNYVPKGVIFDHCTAKGNFGDGTHDAFGDGIGYYNVADHTPDNLIVRYCDIYEYRAGFLMFFGSTCRYNWVHDLYIWSDSHNTSHSIRGENCMIYRCLLTDGTSSAISLYADSDPYTKIHLVENILTVWGNALQEVNFPMRPPDNWNLLQDGYERELIGNRFVQGSSGDNTYFTKVSGNKKLATGKPIFFDTGEPQVAHQPSLQQFKYYDFGNPVGYDQTYEFTPTPNSTLLVLCAPQNGGHGTVPTPVVTAEGQYVTGQTFTKIAETASDPAGDNYQVKLLLYKAQVGSAPVSFEHIKVDWTGNSSASYYGCFWVFEVTASNLVLVKYAPKIDHNPAFGGVLNSLASGNLASAAANGNLVMAFVAGSSMTTDNVMGDQSGWEKIGVQQTTVKPGNSPGVVGAAYWRKDFTGTNMTLSDLGKGISPAGLLLCEFSGV